MEKKVWKKILAVALCLAMLLTMIPLLNSETKAEESTEQPFWVTHYDTIGYEGTGSIMTSSYTGGEWRLHVAFSPVAGTMAYEITAISDGIGTGKGSALAVPEEGFVYVIDRGNNWPALYEEDPNTYADYANEPDYTSDACDAMIERAKTWTEGMRFVFNNIDIENKEVPTSTDSVNWYEDSYMCTATYSKYVEPAQQYVSLPITLRDYAADGMLFEYSEIDGIDTDNDILKTYTHTGLNAESNYSGWGYNDYKGLRIQYYDDVEWLDGYVYWRCVVYRKADGQIMDVLPDTLTQDEKYARVTQWQSSDYNFLWLYKDDDQYEEFCSLITEDNKDDLLITWDGGTYVYVKKKPVVIKTYTYYPDASTTWSTNDYKGFRVQACTDGTWETAWKTEGDYTEADTWICVICNGNGGIIQILPVGMTEAKKDDALTEANTSGYYSIWLQQGDPQYKEFTFLINESSINEFKITYNESTSQISVGRRYHNNGKDNYLMGDTLGFGMLQTTVTDYINNFDIDGTELVTNGSWNQSTAVTEKQSALNSGINQWVYGAYIRTNLVQATLGANGKPIYTENAVDYLANYLHTMLNTPSEVGDFKTTYHVTGVKLFDADGNYVGQTEEAVYDLAEILRQNINGKDTDDDGIPDSYKATVDSDGLYDFDNAYGYMFTIDDLNGTIQTGDTRIMTDKTSYDACGAGFSVSVELVPTNKNANEYEVVGVTSKDDGSIPAIEDWSNGKIVLVVHAAKTTSDEKNGLSKAAAKALQEGNVVTISGNRTTVTVHHSNEKIGTYVAAKDKYDAGNLSLPTQVKTYYEAAYYLLHNIWMDSSKESEQTKNYGKDGYGWNTELYNRINLVQKTDEDGKNIYVFNSGYDDAAYDVEQGAIYNTQTTTITPLTTTTNDEVTPLYTRGNVRPVACFDPLNTNYVGVESCYGNGTNTYGNMLNYKGDQSEYYDKTNYHLSLEGHAKFTYQSDADQYFTFTGDDDVYLYIAGKRVLDIGGAHAISKVSVRLNDVAEECGLEDNKTYSFDFFYAERHGTAANFSIETNIQIVDSSMITTKTGYQDEINTGYNGFVDKNKDIVYEFAIENQGLAAVQELTFTDERIGVSLTKDEIKLNNETTINDLSVKVYYADGTEKKNIAAGSLTEAELKAILETGLAVGEKIIIYGFKYTVPSRMWETRTLEDGSTSNAYFYNILNTTGKSKVGGTSSVDLSGTANWVVQQRSDYNFDAYHLYTWGCIDTAATDKTTLTESTRNPVELTRDELIQLLEDAIPNDEEPTWSNLEIKICNASGHTTHTNSRATINADGGITYTPTNAGADTYYYKVGTYEPVRVDVYTYGASPISYVIDYGLPVELNGAEFGIEAKNVLSLIENPNPTETILDSVNTGSASNRYGNFTYNEETKSLVYTPNAIMNGIDSVGVTISIKETGADSITKFTGVTTMAAEVHVVPANVVYYEDNFPGLVYNNTEKNNWDSYGTVDEGGNSTVGTAQDADQSSNYGSDPNYSEDKQGTLTKESATEAGDASNGTVNKLVINKTADVMSFEFHGTGFEILSRATQGEYAVVSVTIQKRNTNDAYEKYKKQPVITESIGGDVYQVPVISVTDLEEGDYKVIVTATGSRFDAEGNYTLMRLLYIDGIRIYDPLSDELAAKYYNKKEYNANISEVKDLIYDGTIIYADVPVEEGNVTLITGSTLIEDKEGNWVLTSGDADTGTTVDKEAYLNHGPNNELYLNATNMGANVIAFYATPDINISENERTIQIGVHRKSDSMMEFNGYASLVYGSTATSLVNGHNIHRIASGTEQYYPVDVTLLEKDADGRYLVMIGTNGSENVMETLSLTSIKVAGYTISSAENEILTASEAGLLATNGVVSTFGGVYNMLNFKGDDSVDDKVEGDTSDDTTDDVTDGTTDDTTEDVTGGTTDDTTEDVTGGTTDDTTEDVTGGTTEDTTEDVTGGTTDDTEDDVTDGTTDDTEDDVTGGTTDDTEDDVTGGTTDDTEDDVTGGITDDTEDDVTDGTTDDATNSSAFDIQSLMIAIACLCAAILIIMAIVSFIKKDKKGER